MRILTIVSLLLCMCFVQTLTHPVLTTYGIYVDFLIAFSMLAALKCSASKIVFVFWFSGLLYDVFIGSRLGSGCIAGCLTGILFSYMRDAVRCDRFMPKFVVALLSSVVLIILRPVLEQMSFASVINYTALSIYFKQALTTTFLTVLLSVIFDQVDEPQPHRGFGTLGN